MKHGDVQDLSPARSTPPRARGLPAPAQGLQHGHGGGLSPAAPPAVLPGAPGPGVASLPSFSFGLPFVSLWLWPQFSTFPSLPVTLSPAHVGSRLAIPPPPPSARVPREPPRPAAATRTATHLLSQGSALPRAAQLGPTNPRGTCARRRQWAPAGRREAGLRRSCSGPEIRDLLPPPGPRSLLVTAVASASVARAPHEVPATTISPPRSAREPQPLTRRPGAFRAPARGGRAGGAAERPAGPEAAVRGPELSAPRPRRPAGAPGAGSHPALGQAGRSEPSGGPSAPNSAPPPAAPRSGG